MAVDVPDRRYCSPSVGVSLDLTAAPCGAVLFSRLFAANPIHRGGFGAPQLVGVRDAWETWEATALENLQPKHELNTCGATPPMTQSTSGIANKYIRDLRFASRIFSNRRNVALRQ